MSPLAVARRSWFVAIAIPKRYRSARLVTLPLTPQEPVTTPRGEAVVTLRNSGHAIMMQEIRSVIHYRNLPSPGWGRSVSTRSRSRALQALYSLRWQIPGHSQWEPCRTRLGRSLRADQRSDGPRLGPHHRPRAAAVRGASRSGQRRRLHARRPLDRLGQRGRHGPGLGRFRLEGRLEHQPHSLRGDRATHLDVPQREFCLVKMPLVPGTKTPIWFLTPLLFTSPAHCRLKTPDKNACGEPEAVKCISPAFLTSEKHWPSSAANDLAV